MSYPDNGILYDHLSSIIEDKPGVSGMMHYSAMLKLQNEKECPYCHNPITLDRINKHTVYMIDPLSRAPIIMHIKRQRYNCKKCGGFVAHADILTPGEQFTRQFMDFVVNEWIVNGVTFSDLAEKYEIKSPRTIAKYIDSLIDIFKAKKIHIDTPDWLIVFKFQYGHNLCSCIYGYKDNCFFVCGFLDQYNKVQIENYIRSIINKPDRIKVLVYDLAEKVPNLFSGSKYTFSAIDTSSAYNDIFDMLSDESKATSSSERKQYELQKQSIARILTSLSSIQFECLLYELSNSLDKWLNEQPLSASKSTSYGKLIAEKVQNVFNAYLLNRNPIMPEAKKTREDLCQLIELNRKNKLSSEKNTYRVMNQKPIPANLYCQQILHSNNIESNTEQKDSHDKHDEPLKCVTLRVVFDTPEYKEAVYQYEMQHKEFCIYNPATIDTTIQRMQKHQGYTYIMEKLTKSAK